jgi:hypothetical protein
MADIVTVNPDQLGEAPAATDEMAAVVFAPGGPLQKLAFDKLLAKLISTSLCKADKATLDADLAHDEDAVALVYNDATALLNGWYRKTGATGVGAWMQFEVLARAARDAAVAAVADAAAQAAISRRYANNTDDADFVGGAPGERGARFWFNATVAAIIANLGRLYSWIGGGTRAPFWVDLGLNELLGADTAPADGVSFYRGHFVDWLRSLPFSVGQLMTFSGLYRLFNWLGISTRSPFWVDKEGNLLLGANSAPADGNSWYEGHFHDYLLAKAGGSASTGYAPISLGANAPIFTPNNSYIGMPTTGQSLNVGALATPVISTVQPFGNVMLTGGVKSTGTGFVPMVEDTNQEGGVASGNRGETICSSATTYACKLFAIDGAGDPSSLKFWASAAGQGGTRLLGISKGTTSYNRLLSQVTNATAAAVAGGRNLVVPAVPIIHGPTDSDIGTDRATYLAQMLQLAADLNTDIKAITGQSSPVHILMVQSAYKAATVGTVQLAQMDAVEQSPLIHMVCNDGFLPINNSDGQKVHLTNVGEVWLGHYVGRAIFQLLYNGKKPDCIWPLGATYNGTTVRVKFRTPTKLVLNGPTQTNYGFKLVDDAGMLTLSNIKVVDNHTVIFTIDRAVVGTLNVRYAMDYCAAANILGGGCGDLTDSTSETIVISGITYSLVHRSPAFIRTAYAVEA